MKTLYLLIMLTQNSAGDINAAFVNTETLEQCQQKTMMVKGVFKGSNIPVLESRCIKSDMQFSEFGHAANSKNIRHFYLTYFNDEEMNHEEMNHEEMNDKGARIVAMPNWRTCVQQEKNLVENGRVYCTSSVQSVQ